MVGLNSASRRIVLPAQCANAQKTQLQYFGKNLSYFGGTSYFSLTHR
jgi:hypothetical protein